jgi:hypothetical protein
LASVLCCGLTVAREKQNELPEGSTWKQSCPLFKLFQPKDEVSLRANFSWSGHQYPCLVDKVAGV